MSGSIFDAVFPAWLGTAAAVALTGAAVKLMDDWLDAEQDAAAGRPNWSSALGRASPVYALALLAVAATLDPAAAGSLFLASYALGMLWGGDEFPRRQPSRLPAWLEAALAVLVGAGTTGPLEMVGALGSVAALQLADHLWDTRREPPSLHRLGRTEGVLGALAATFAAFAATPGKTAAALLFGLAVIWRTGPVKEGEPTG